MQFFGIFVDMDARIVPIILLLLLHGLIVCGQPVKIIFDTDMESDVDDVAALAMLHGFADRGEVEILATVSSSLNPWSAPVIDVINTYYGRPDIPIGNVKTFGVYRKSMYAKTIAEAYPQDIGLGEDAPDATDLYRRILAGEPDTSVVIVTVGYVTNLSRLLQSGPDDHSPLPGKALIEKKVKRYVCMGGRYPLEQNPGRWGNFKPDPEAARHVVDHWPTRITFTVGGRFSHAIPTGKILFTDRVSADNPVAEAYAIFLEGRNRHYHHSSDLIAVYVAVRGPDPYFSVRTRGYFHLFEDGTHVWRWDPDRPNHHVISEFSDGIDSLQVAADFDAMLVR